MESDKVNLDLVDGAWNKALNENSDILHDVRRAKKMIQESHVRPTIYCFPVRFFDEHFGEKK